MADSSVPITAGSGTNVDTFTQASGDHRQAMVVGDASAAYTAAVDSSSRLAVVTPSTYTTGTITAANANITSGTATANSTVSVTVPDGHSSWDVFVSGTFSTGTLLYFQGSLDNTNWFSLNGRRNSDASTNDTTNFIASDFAGGASPSGGNPSNWRGNIGSIRYFRVTAFSYTAADSIAVQIATSSAVGTTFLNNVPDFRILPDIRTVTTLTPATVATAQGAIFQSRIVATAITTGTAAVLAPGSGYSIYVTDFSVSNSGSTLTVVSLLPAAGTAQLDLVAAGTGGGGTMNLKTPMKLAANTALHYAMTAASTSVYINISGYVQI